MPTPLEIALGYIKRGWNPIPVSRQTKKPIGNGWQKRCLDSETVAEAFNGADMNIGVQLGGAATASPMSILTAARR
jgi:Bifunctional DNA primase/polymerase, N-terminal